MTLFFLTQLLVFLATRYFLGTQAATNGLVAGAYIYIYLCNNYKKAK